MIPRICCTLFDATYAVKGAVMAESLFEHSSAPIELHILALDSTAWAVADWLAGSAPCVHAVMPCSLNTLEARWPKLPECRATREWGHYCWQLGSCFARDVTNREGSPLAYLDADLHFHGDAEDVWREAEKANASVSVVPHRFPPQYSHYACNGKFNVSWVGFHDVRGTEVLERWAEQCENKCDAESIGDQKYLDAWPELLGDKLHAFKSRGIGAAPWNVWSYTLYRRGKRIVLDGDALMFYHMHEWQPERRTRGYPLRQVDIDMIYRPYEREYERCQARILSAGISLPDKAKIGG